MNERIEQQQQTQQQNEIRRRRMRIGTNHQQKKPGCSLRLFTFTHIFFFTHIRERVQRTFGLKFELYNDIPLKHLKLLASL